MFTPETKISIDHINKTNKVHISFQTINRTAKILSCKNMTIGLGVTPPKN